MAARAECGAFIQQAWQRSFLTDVPGGTARRDGQSWMVRDAEEMKSARQRVREIGKRIPGAPEDLPEPVLSRNGMEVLAKRYLAKEADGRVTETSKGLFWRVAYNIAAAEVCWGASSAEIASRARDFYQLMASLDFLPNSPTLMNAGKGLQQLSGCFVLPVADDMRSIMGGATAAALIHQSGGGTGFSFSNLRPEGDLVSRSGGEASGPVSFMKIYDQVTATIKQGGRRRGANMGCLSVHHPDILGFIRAKQTAGVLENFNLSVLMTDPFMRAVQEDGEYELINSHTGASKRVKARQIFDEIVRSAWASGEPGVIFIDAINKANPTKHLGEIESTNPCGEQPLHPYESCNLGSINLAHMIIDGRFNEERLRIVVRQAVRFMDDVIEMNQYPLPEIEAMTLANRRIGLGIMGFADMLIQMGLAYDSEEGVAAAENAMRIIQEEGYAESARLAQERGVFPNWKGSEHEKQHRLMRNATITTIAPTGSISLIAGSTSGCEPYFALAYDRKHQLDGNTTLREANPYFFALARQMGVSEGVLERILETGKARGVKGVPEELQRLFATAQDISVEWHIRMQAAFQKWTDNAVSKTINMPNWATVEDVAQAYLLAYQLGCKGVTIYRDGSRETQVIQVGKEKGPENDRAVSPLDLYERPSELQGTTVKVGLGCGRNLYITMNREPDGRFVEVFASIGKSGGCTSSENEAIGRLVSLALQGGIPAAAIIKQLRGIRCPAPGMGKGGSILSCADAIAKSLSRYLGLENGHLPEDRHATDPPGEGDEMNTLVRVDLGHNPECPDCGTMLESKEGCISCPNPSCGFSHCG